MSKRTLLLILLGLGISLAHAETPTTAADGDTSAQTATSAASGDAEAAKAETPAEPAEGDEQPESSAADDAGQTPASGDAEKNSGKNLLAGDAKAGAKLSATCAACHGADGNSTNPAWPKLAGQGAPYIYEQLQEFKNGKRKNAIMAGQAAGLSDQDMQDVAVYFAQQKTKPGVADESLVERGGSIYHGGIPDKDVPACSGCHGPSGLGQPPAQFPRLSGQHAAYIDAQLTAYRDGDRAGSRNGQIMTDVAARLTDDDIKALSSYVEGLAPQAAE